MADESTLKSGFVGTSTTDQEAMDEYHGDTTLANSSETYLQELYTKLNDTSDKEPRLAKN